MENIIIKFIADTEGLKPAIDQLMLMGKLSEDDAKKIQSINDSQKQYLQTLNNTTTSAGKLNTEVKELEKVIKTKVLDEMAISMEDFSHEAGNATTKTISLKKELKLLKEQIASGQFSGKELQQMTRRAAELQDRIGDVNTRIRALASDTKRIDAVVTAFRGLAAAGAVAAGAASLLGNNNEDLQKTLVRVQSSMALLNGLQEIATLLTTESAAKTMVLNAAQKAAAISSRILGVTITTSMAAATMGITLIIAAIAAVVLAMNDAEEEGSEAADKLISRMQNDAKLLAKSNDIRLSIIKDARKRELSQEELSYNRQVLEHRQMLDRKEIDLETYIVFMEALNSKHQQSIVDINKKYDELDAERARKAHDKKVQEQNKHYDEMNRLLDKMQDDTLNAIEQERKATESYIDMMHKQDKEAQEALAELIRTELAASEMSASQMLDIQAARLEAEYANEEDFTNKYLEMLRKRNEETKLMVLDSVQSISDAIFQITSNRLRHETDLQLEGLNTEREQALKSKELTEEQRLRIEDRYREQERQIKRQEWERQRQADISSAIIATALAVARALPNPALAITAGVAGAAQVAIIASQPTPRFAEGTEYFIGKGTGTSDNNLAWLSSGERVVSARTNADYYGALSAIHNREVDPGLANNIMNALKTMDLTLAPQYSKPTLQDKQLDPIELANILERNRTQVSINLDEQGFTKHIRKSTTTTNYRNSKFRMNA